VSRERKKYTKKKDYTEFTESTEVTEKRKITHPSKLGARRRRVHRGSQRKRDPRPRHKLRAWGNRKRRMDRTQEGFIAQKTCDAKPYFAPRTPL
jgi:hypothetical protein